MKIAYLLLCHRDPLLLKRVINVLSGDESGFFVHIDRKSDIGPFACIKSNHVFLCDERMPVYWAEFSQIEATMLLIRRALASPACYGYLVFLQGSTYPLRSCRYIHDFLEQNRYSEFMNLVRMPAPGYPLSKINTLRYPSTKPVRRLGARALAKIGLARRDYTKYLGQMEPYSGHACWGLSREACRYIIDFVDSNPAVNSYFENTFVPEESFFQTILGNSPFRTKARKLFVYADWSKSMGHHPAALDETHVALFESQERVWIEDEWGAGEMLFARKLSDDRLDLVDQIDEMILRKDRVDAL